MLINRRRDEFWDTDRLGDRIVLYLHDHLYQAEAFAVGALASTVAGGTIEAVSSGVEPKIVGAGLLLTGLALATGFPRAFRELREDIQYAQMQDAQISTELLGSTPNA